MVTTMGTTTRLFGVAALCVAACVVRGADAPAEEPGSHGAVGSEEARLERVGHDPAVGKAMGEESAAAEALDEGNSAPARAADEPTAPAPGAEAAPDATTPRASVPLVLHAPPPAAMSGAPLTLSAEVVRDWGAERFFVVYRPLAEASWREARLERVGTERWIATVAAADVHAPGLAYAIASEAAGQRRYHFATVDNPMTLRIDASSADLLAAMRRERHGGRANNLRVNVAHTDFATRVVGIGDARATTREGSEWLWALSAEYRHRLWAEVYDIHFSVHAGAVVSARWSGRMAQRPCVIRRGAVHTRASTRDGVV
jgi:hypothetical protein